MSFYLKFRPQRVSELDLVAVRDGLWTILQSGKLPHAFLFLGPRGAGKTSAARILAKAVNCEKNRTRILKGEALEEPCLICERCGAIGSGHDVDVIEIDAASNRGIDDIRALRENVGLSPVMSVKKVYVIDEVHMLSMDAFNALLKTIEEPPAHVMFVLCTTEAHKVPATVVSRCTLINFTKATPEELAVSLAKVVEGEKLAVSSEALLELARYVDGSFREAHKLLEQLSMMNGKIDIEAVKRLVGVGTTISPVEFVQVACEGSVEEVLEVVGRVDTAGVSWTNYLKSVLEVVRLELRGVYGLGERRLEVSRDKLVRLAEALLGTINQIKASPVEVLTVELMMIGLHPGEEGKAVKRDEVVEVKMQRKEPVLAVQSGPAIEEVTNGKETSVDRVINTSLQLGEVVNNWDRVLETLEPMNHSVASLLRLQKISEVRDGELIVEVAYKFHKEQLENEAKRVMIEEALSQVVGGLRFRCVLREKEHTDDQEAKEMASAVEDVFGLA